MTEETKKLIDELPVVAKSVINWKDAELVDKDDVIALVEKLTGWTKVEDGLPKKSSRVNFKSDTLDYDGKNYIGCCDYTGEHFCTQLNVIEWKPIIL